MSSSAPGVEADVDVVVAVHDLTRWIDRAVTSALSGISTNGRTPRGYRVRTVVACHELDPNEVAARLPQWTAPHTHLIPVCDGTPSPAGPFNAALDEVTARYLAVLGSDDWFADGALDAWVAHADREKADAVLARLVTQRGEVIRTPRTRPARHRRLDFVADRLAYRTAPLGLLRTSLVRGLGVRFTPGLTSGVDLEAGLRLWTSGTRIDLGGPAPYMIGLDAGQRITERRRSVREELSAHRRLVDLPWLHELSEDQRRSIALKLLRIHLLAAVRRRPAAADWTVDDAAFVVELADDIMALAPGVTRGLHRADLLLLRSLTPDPGTLAAASVRRGAAGRWDILLTPSPPHNLDREATLRAHLATAADRAWARATEHR